MSLLVRLLRNTGQLMCVLSCELACLALPAKVGRARWGAKLAEAKSGRLNQVFNIELHRLTQLRPASEQARQRADARLASRVGGSRLAS